MNQVNKSTDAANEDSIDVEHFSLMQYTIFLLVNY